MSRPSTKIKMYRKRAKLTQEELSDAAEIPLGTLRRWEQSGSDIRNAFRLSPIADVLGCSVDELLGRGDIFPQEAIAVKAALGKMIPVYGDIAAGTPVEMIVTKYAAEAPLTLIKNRPNVFWLRVNGDSFNREVLDGSLVLIDPDESINNGDAVAVNINGFDATLKRYTKTSNTIILSPSSYNPENKDIIIDESDPSADQLRIIGKKIWAMYPHPDMIDYRIVDI